MRKKKDGFLREQSGVIMLEATLIMVSVIMICLAMLALSFYFYQQSMMVSVATEIASDVARNYKYEGMEIGDDIITEKNQTDLERYRMSYHSKKMENKAKKRAEKYVKKRFAGTNMGGNREDAEVECEIVKTGTGRVYVKVTLSHETNVFLGEILSIMGITEDETKFQVTAYAECMDLMQYTSLVNFTDYTANELDYGFSRSDLQEKVKEFIQKLEN